MTLASSIPLSSTLRVLSQNINGFQTKITMRKCKQKRIVALGSLLRSLEVDFFAIQEPHFVTVEDRQAGVQCLSKYGYGLDGPLLEEGRGGVALAWKTSKWTLQSMKFLSPRALKASLSSGPLDITIVVVHFHHKHTRRQSQWKDIAKELHGPNLILCADHNSLVVKHRDAFAPPEFEHDTSLRARDQEVTTLAKAGMQDVWVDIHCPTLTDIKDKEASCPTGFTYGYPREGERLDPQRLRRIDRIHTTSELLSLATSVYPMFAANSDHKAILAEFTPPSFDTDRGHGPHILLPRDHPSRPGGNGRSGDISQVYQVNRGSMVGRDVELHPKEGDQPSKGAYKQKAVGRTTGPAVPAWIHERLCRTSGLSISIITGDRSNRCSNSLHPPGGGVCKGSA